MDIIVTIPKSEYEAIDKEIEWAEAKGTGLIKGWSMSRLPKNLEHGDRCYFIRNGHVEHYREILGIEDMEDFTCEVTGRYWKAPYLELSAIPVTLKQRVP